MDYSTTYTNQQAGSWASDENAEIQVRFETQQKKYSVTDKPFSVPTRLKRYGLSEVINHLLQLGGCDYDSVRVCLCVKILDYF